MEPLTASFWAAVRLTEGTEWMDNSTTSGLRHLSQEAADKSDRFIPVWAKDNPVQRIARFDAVERKG